MVLEIAAWSGLVLWVTVLLLPWRPWAVRERLEPRGFAPVVDLSDITAVVPARDEAATIGRTVTALARQGTGLRILVIDDESSDGTGTVAAGAGGDSVTVIAGAPLPTGWTGKLWALEQARGRVRTPRILLVDADIELRPGMVAALRERMERGRYALVSVMARLRMETFWERLLMPAFVWFFRLLYPFALANRPGSRFAAAAGGCILVERHRLEAIGGFGALRDAVIDDCTLAARIKRAGGATWVGLTHGAISHRSYRRLADVHEMVARTAFAQLRYSWLLLAACTLLMLAAFPAPWVGLVWGGSGHPGRGCERGPALARAVPADAALLSTAAGMGAGPAGRRLSLPGDDHGCGLAPRPGHAGTLAWSRLCRRRRGSALRAGRSIAVCSTRPASAPCAASGGRRRSCVGAGGDVRAGRAPCPCGASEPTRPGAGRHPAGGPRRR